MPSWSTVLPSTSTSEHGDIRRAFDPHVHPELGLDGCRTLYEALRHEASSKSLSPCLGYRSTSTNGMATPFTYFSYSEVIAKVNCIAAGLEALDLIDKSSDIPALALYIPNCVEWVLCEHAAYTVGAATVPLYDTLGPDAARYILEQTKVRAVVCTRAQLENLPQINSLQTAIVIDGLTPECSSLTNLELISLAKIEGVGAHVLDTTGHQHSPPAPHDISTFCYTSGTTGNPKGALLTHQSMLSAAAGVAVFGLGVHAGDRHLSFLPLAHIFERVVHVQLLLKGASIAFYRNNPLYLIEDWVAARPTVLIAVPRVLNKIYDKVSGILILLCV